LNNFSIDRPLTRKELLIYNKTKLDENWAEVDEKLGCAPVSSSYWNYFEEDDFCNGFNNPNYKFNKKLLETPTTNIIHNSFGTKIPKIKFDPYLLRRNVNVRLSEKSVITNDVWIFNLRKTIHKKGNWFMGLFRSKWKQEVEILRTQVERNRENSWNDYRDNLREIAKLNGDISKLRNNLDELKDKVKYNREDIEVLSYTVNINSYKKIDKREFEYQEKRNELKNNGYELNGVVDHMEYWITKGTKNGK
jgi:hypothetical protein